MPPRRPTDESNHKLIERVARLETTIEANDRRYLEMFMAADKAVNAALAAAEKAVTAALTAANRATEKAEETQRRVNEGQNEFRQQLKDQAATFVTREVLEGVLARVGLVERFQSSTSGTEKGRVDIRSILFASGALILSIIAILERFFLK